MRALEYFQSFSTALDSDIVSQLLPLGDSIVGAFVTLVTAFFTYLIGKKRSEIELRSVKEEKDGIEAAAGISTVEAAKIISEAAATSVQPLVERVREQRQEMKYLSERLTESTQLVSTLRNDLATAQAENELLKNRFRLRGETPPELP